MSDALTLNMIRRRRPDGGPAASRMGVVRKAQIDALLSVSPVMIAANVVNSGALLLLLSGLGRVDLMAIVWWALVMAVNLHGLRGLLRARRRPPRAEASVRAPGAAVASAVALAAVWSLPALRLTMGIEAVELAFVSSLTAGMVAGGALALYPIPLAAFTYTLVLTLAVIPGVLAAMGDHTIPFLIVMSAFVGVVLYAIRYQAGVFFQELDARMEAERQRDVAGLFLDTYHGAGGQCVWEAGPDLTLRTDVAPFVAMVHGSVDADAPSTLPGVLAGSRPHDPDSRRALDALAAGDADALLEAGATVVAPSGSVLRLSARALSAERGGYLGYVKDVTAEMRARDEIAWLAARDALTGLLNRRAFLEAGERLLAELFDRGTPVMVLFLDADNLKMVNDTHGHRAGDEAIRAVARALPRALPADALVARKGGDEFVALVPLHDGRDANALALGALDAARARFRHDGRDVAFSCSIGATVRPAQPRALERMELEADRALYFAKSSGRRRLRFHDAEMGLEVRRRRRLALDVRTAIDEGRIGLVFQPIVDARTGLAVAAEALLRWDHVEFGAVPPPEVLDLARSEGMGGRLSLHVLQAACEEACRWPGDAALSVNLSPSDFRSRDLPDRVEGVLRAVGMPPLRLWTEITEAEVIGDNETVRTNIERVRSLGVHVAIDDVGAGYSSLSAFDHNAFDVLKIDRSLVADGASRPNSRLILGAIARFAEANGCRVVAEGVETREELDLVTTAGFDLVQGFVFHRPMPPLAVHDLLAREARAALPAC